MRAALHPNLDAPANRFGDRWLLLLAICLAGYALDGRGFAYLGYPPIFIGEFCFVIGLLAWSLTRGWSRMMSVGPAVAVLPLVMWGAVLLVPGVSRYQLDAVRDAVIWGYAAFALFVASLLVAQPQRLVRMIDYYRVFSKLFLVGIPITFIIYRYFRAYLPQWPGSGAPFVQVKEGDAMVHLAGILAFWMADYKRHVRWFWGVLLTLNMAALGVVDRAGVVAFAAVMIICVIAKPRHRAVWRTVAMAAAALVLLWASQANIEVPGGKGRNISWEQFVENTRSIFGEGARSSMEGNKEWRLQWWGTIVDYTFHGQYFWTGKGFGINLADDDNFQVNADKTLRAPHSIHMSFLARMGVPGLVLWGAMNLAWLLSVGDAHLRARRRGQLRWAGLFLFLFAYYVAFVVNGSFDVFIEGPMGGIWFWSIYGAGVASLWIWRHQPQVLADAEDNEIDEGARRTQFLPAAGWRRPGVPLGAGAARVARA